MQPIHLALTLSMLFQGIAFAAEKPAKPEAPRKPAELTDREKALAEQGEHTLRELDKGPKEPLPKSLQDKMQKSGPNPRGNK